MPKKPNEFEEFLAGTPDAWKPVVAEPRTLVRKLAPNLTEAMRYRMPSFLKGRRPVVYIMPTRDHVNLGFYDGVDLEDPKNILEGTGKRLRHVKVRGVQEARNPAIRGLSKQPYAIPRNRTIGVLARAMSPAQRVLTARAETSRAGG